MKIRNQILALGLAGAMAAAAVGGIALYNVLRLAADLRLSVGQSSALQSSQEADMMHDAIRSDVLLALIGGINKDPAQIADAQKSLQEHSEVFEKSLKDLQALPVSADVKTMIDGNLLLVKKYKESASKTIKFAATDVVIAQSNMPDFQKAFADLETQMAIQSEVIEKDLQAIVQSTENDVMLSKYQIGITIMTALALMILGALRLSKAMSDPLVHAASVADRLAQGDFTGAVRPAGNDEMVQLLNSMAHMKISLSAMVSTIKSSAEHVAMAGNEIAQGNQDLSSRTETQASALEETAASMEELGDQVKNNAANSLEANQLAIHASMVATKGGEVVGQVVQTMQGINDSSRKIADIISVIDGIAFQTNILALNAAVEAARAGDQGRGFAVVAAEVRSLAGRSADAAKEIKSLINASVERVEQGTILVDKAGETMSEVVSSIRKATDLMGAISVASNEQASGVAQVVEAVTQMDQTTQQNAALVEEMAAAAGGLKSQANELVQAVAAFKVDSAAHS